MRNDAIAGTLVELESISPLLNADFAQWNTSNLRSYKSLGRSP
jgi:hypothetical protein